MHGAPVINICYFGAQLPGLESSKCRNFPNVSNHWLLAWQDFLDISGISPKPNLWKYLFACAISILFGTGVLQNCIAETWFTCIKESVITVFPNVCERVALQQLWSFLLSPLVLCLLVLYSPYKHININTLNVTVMIYNGHNSQFLHAACTVRTHVNNQFNWFSAIQLLQCTHLKHFSLLLLQCLVSTMNYANWVRSRRNFPPEEWKFSPPTPNVT